MNLDRHSPRAFLPPSTRMGEMSAAMKTEQILRQWKDAGYVVPLIDEDGPRFALWDLADGIADFFRREENALFVNGNEIEATVQAQIIVGVLAKLCREGVMQNFKKALDEQNVVCSPLVPPRFDAMTENGNSSSGVSHEQIFHLASGIP